MTAKLAAKLTASLKSLWKYAFWTFVAAGALGLVDKIGNMDLPFWLVPTFAAILKALATFAATQAEK